MGYYAPDVYYQPEQFGLTPVFEYELEVPSWSFNKLVIWRHEGGSLYWGHDSGCSCPTPFEDYTAISDLHEYDYAAIESLLREYTTYTYNSRVTEDNIEGILYELRTVARSAHI